MALNFDLNKLMDDPVFVGSVGLLGGSGPGARPLLTAYQMLAEQRAAKQQQAQQERAFGLQQQRLGMDQERLGMDREEQQFMRPLRQAQVATAQQNAANLAETNRLRAEEHAAKLARIEWFKGALPYFMRGQVPPGGMMPPTTSGMQPQSGPADPMPDEPTGKFGTPVRYLDALEQVESSGNPLAVGPVIGSKNGKPIRAKGAYQFLDDTVDMVANEGFGKFDPFNRKQARDAADFYIQKLYKQHGSYEKAFAAYGGFKAKDPTPYITKVMGGPPERQAQQKTQNQANVGMQQGNQYPPTMQPGFKFDLEEGNVEIDIKPSYEPHRLRQADEGLELQRLQERRESGKFREEYGPGGYKSREAKRQDIQTGLDISKDDREEAEAARIAGEKAHAFTVTKTKDWKAFAAVNANTDLLTGKIDKLVNHPGLPRIAGLKGTLPDFPGSDAAAARAELASIVAQNAKETLTAMRDASQTGGALGNVSDADIKLLERSIKNLETAQGNKALREALTEVRKHTSRLREIAITSYEKMYGESPIDKDLPVGSRLSDKRTKAGKPLYKAPNGKLYEVE